MLFKILLTIHIMGGFSSLLLGTYILLTRKGTKIHKKVGLIYFYAMLSAAVVSLPMAFLHPSYFLFLIGVFTIYMLLSGKRYLQIKNTTSVKQLDWALSLTIFAFGLGFIFFGVDKILEYNNFGVVFIAFGSVGLLFAYQDFKNFTGKTKYRNFFLTSHLQRMIGSYIASITAFLVVNNTYLPSVIAWLLPSIVLVPMIIFWIKKYRKI